MATKAVPRDNKPVFKTEGVFHDLDVYSDRLVIHHKDVLSRLFSSDEVIFYKDIEGLHVFKPATSVSSGSQLIINGTDGKTWRLSYSAEHSHVPQHVKETVEDLIAEGIETPI